MTRPAVSHGVTDLSYENKDPTNALDIGLPASSYSLEKLYDAAANWADPFRAWIGAAWSWALSIGTVAVALKVLLSCTCRTGLVCRRRGCGYWIIPAMFSTSYAILSTPFSLGKAMLDQILKPLEKLAEDEPEIQLSVMDLVSILHSAVEGPSKKR